MDNSLNLRSQCGLGGDTQNNQKQLHVVCTISELQLEELATKKRDAEVSTKEKNVGRGSEKLQCCGTHLPKEITTLIPTKAQKE